MTDLLNLALKAHGGLDRWQKVKTLEARASVGGAIWPLKGWEGHLEDASFTVDAQHQHVEYRSGAAPGQRSIYEPDRTSILADDGQLVGERTSPRASFADHKVTTPWDSQHIIYFSGYAIWTYLTTPFLFARPGFEVQEIDPWDGEGEVWRRLRVKFPPDVPSHSAEQTFYFGPDGVLRRHDYSVEIMGVFGGTSSANYALEPREFDGLVYPTQRRVYRIGENNLPLRDNVLVSIDIHDVKAA
ncbi:hypothetical protein [Sphingopyxis chilensis]|uniref:hypothetical protein n=1 Tax=Sphingopyxis chilensis TaxID=180400 RepID=UPI002DDCE34A|nr:hypothetical protein [Sphingopyxis chilensis]